MRAETGRAPNREGQGRREDHQGSGIGSIVTATYDILPAGEAASPTVDPYQLLPDLTPEEYAALRDDIEANGLRVPVDVDEDGNVLDGHHRQRVATELGIDYPTRVVPGLTETGKRDHALAVNTARRQLSRDQRRQVIANSLSADPELSDREHARRVGCSPSTVGSVRRELSGEVSKLDTFTDADIAEFRRQEKILQKHFDDFGKLLIHHLIEAAKDGEDLFEHGALWHREVRTMTRDWPGADEPEFIEPVRGIFDRIILVCTQEVQSMVDEAARATAAAETPVGAR